MGTMQKIAIIVPCYNESLRFIGQEFIDYAKDNKEVYFIFVDDGSTDDTKEKINVLCRSNPEQILCLSLKKNHGKAEAVRHGFLKAIEMDFENIGFWDVDLSTPLKFINRFCELFDNHGITAVMVASYYGRIKIAKLLIQYEADVNIQNNEGITALMAAR